MTVKKPLDSATSIKEIRRILNDSLPSRSLFEKYRPSEDWFFRHECLCDIHGINHETRVMVIQEIISLILIKTQSISLDQEALRWASATHDIRRRNDGLNLRHGIRSSKWVSKNLSSLIPSESLEKVKIINHWHSVWDNQIPNLIPELIIFKDADALDRVRSNDLDPQFLRYDFSYELLFNPSLDLFTKTYHSDKLFDSVLDAAVEIGLINK